MAKAALASFFCCWAIHAFLVACSLQLTAAQYPPMAPGTVRNVAVTRTSACRRARSNSLVSIILGATNDVHNAFEEVSGACLVPPAAGRPN